MGCGGKCYRIFFTEMTSAKEKRIVIVGGGLAGLACARELHAAGYDFLLCEAAERLGGRMVTDVVEGFRLDRGFQVLLTAYPEARRLLDYRALDLREFFPGAMIRQKGQWHVMADPLRQPLAGIKGAFSPIGSFWDKCKIGRAQLRGFDFSKYADDVSTRDALRAEGYSSSMIDGFFQPFLSGVFLENQLATSVRKLAFVMKYFAKGATAVPALGMQQIPLQIASGLPQEKILLRAKVAEIRENGVGLSDGRFLNAAAVVVATEQPVAARLLGETAGTRRANATICLYFSTSAPPVTKPILLLNGDSQGPVNHLAVMSTVSPAYAPAGQHLVSVNVVDPRWMADDDLQAQVLKQMEAWFGKNVKNWQFLRMDRIPYAVPRQDTIANPSPKVHEGIYQCGDYCGVSSIDTALVSGTRAAQSAINDLRNSLG